MKLHRTWGLYAFNVCGALSFPGAKTEFVTLPFILVWMALSKMFMVMASQSVYGACSCLHDLLKKKRKEARFLRSYLYREKRYNGYFGKRE